MWYMVCGRVGYVQDEHGVPYSRDRTKLISSYFGSTAPPP